MRRAQRRKYHYFYKTVCIITNRYYYGMHSTDNLDDGYTGSGKRLWYSINKHGKENHICEKLEFFETREELRKREAEIVNKDCIKDPYCMNLQLGGGGGFTNKEHMMKCSLAGAYNGGKVAGKIIGNRMKDPNYNKETKQKWSRAGNEWWKGKKHLEVSKQKMSNSHKGKHEGELNSQFGTCWITNEKENKKIYKGDIIPNGFRLGRKLK